MVLSISIVVYKPEIQLLKEVTASAGKSVSAAGLRANDAKLVIVNNCPEEPLSPQLVSELRDTCVSFTQFDYVESGANDGYGAGNNLAMRSSDAMYYLVLNPDGVLTETFVARAIEFMDQNRSVGLLTPRVVGFDGEQHYLCKRNPTVFDMFLRSGLPSFFKRAFKDRMDRFEMRDMDYSKTIAPIPYPTGCCMFFRGDVMRQLGGFDERFFLYLEDADIGRRVNEVATTLYHPDVVVMHKWTRGTHRGIGLWWETVRATVIYVKKWGGWI